MGCPPKVSSLFLAIYEKLDIKLGGIQNNLYLCSAF